MPDFGAEITQSQLKTRGVLSYHLHEVGDMTVNTYVNTAQS